MIQSVTDAHIHYRHSEEEVAQLAKAVVPLHDAIVAVSSPAQRGKLTTILRGNYFRRGDIVVTRAMLLRAVKYARAHLGDYFPVMRQQLLEDAQALEDALVAYWTQFAEEAHESVPTH
jgi:hypothetical protein